ncbi:MAG: homocysteine S-methyltransferase family protein [Bacteroidota bacterium]
MEGPLARLLATQHPVILDGAMGTELQSRGVDIGLPLWSANALLTSPETVRQIHEDYIRAGADIITTDTFRTTQRTFRRAGIPDRSAELTALAVALAKEARDAFPDRSILIAGCVAPLEDCYHPELVPSEEELRSEHVEHAQRLSAAGVDLLLLETMGTVREARAAAKAAHATGKEFIVSFICNEKGDLLGGDSLGNGVAAVAPFGPSAISINCVSPRYIDRAIQSMNAAMGALHNQRTLPVGVYANVGVPGDEDSEKLVRDVDTDEYVSYVRRWLRAGVRIIGGCCGTGPEDIRLIALAVKQRREEREER